MSRIEESIIKMRAYIEEIEAKAKQQADILETDGKVQVDAIASKTIETISNSINKLASIKEQITDENEMNDFLDRLEGKCKDVTEFTINKIDSVKPVIKEAVIDFKKDLENTFNNFKIEEPPVVEEKKEAPQATKNSLEAFLENENVRSAIKLAKETKDKAVEIYNRPETQKMINEAKVKVIDIAEKGLDALKYALDRVDENKENK